MWDQLEEIIGAYDKQTNAEAVLARLGTPSTSIAILDKDRIHTKCFSTIGSNTETVFQACSISKPVAGMAAMRLVEQGLLKLDAPITGYLPPSTMQLLATPSTAHLIGKITVKQLMSHTSGLAVHGFPGYVKELPEAETIIRGKQPSNTMHVHLDGVPGHRFAYSGGGITVLQLIMEQVTQKSFPALMKELVFGPLDMQRSFYGRPTDGGNYAPAFYTGYQPCEVEYHVHPEVAAAGLWTTPSDLVKVVRAMQRSLEGHDMGFLHREAARQMLTEVSDGMALTWMARRDPGISFQHTGGNWGYRCILLGWADLHRFLGSEDSPADNESADSGLCVMTNSDAGLEVVWKIVSAVSYLKGWAALPHVYGNAQAGIAFGAPGDEIPAAWREWAGSWGDWKLIETDGMPHVVFKDLPAIKLHRAARPKLEDGFAIDLVLHGLEMMLRLTSSTEEKVIELWHGPKGDIKTLHKEVPCRV